MSEGTVMVAEYTEVYGRCTVTQGSGLVTKVHRSMDYLKE